MLACQTEHIPAVSLQFSQARLDDVRLLGAIEMFAAPADPLLGLEQEVGELWKVRRVRASGSLAPAWPWRAWTNVQA